ncbi:hypothetical protein FV242_26680 [Methylobacterium sp. WL64]|uniref:hypothetical protein n=1 Tax=Methylobacterium sp. WL64 TaxID=2603894 RepID=UPI0011CBCAD4|nr:hypothetical protein [Methylobacterium sp. WL64]TXM99095.1 hypothetical protein FV242_26680 [Methylobacterium sp. WL64]
MKLKYKGSLSGLQNATLDCGVFGDWSWNERERLHRFRSTEGEIMHWWPSTGTVLFQGRPGPLQRRLTTVFTRLVANDDGVHLVRSRAIIS